MAKILGRLVKSAKSARAILTVPSIVSVSQSLLAMRNFQNLRVTRVVVVEGKESFTVSTIDFSPQSSGEKRERKLDREWGENKNGAADDRSRLTLTTSSETPDAIDLASLMVASSPMTLSSMVSQHKEAYTFSGKRTREGEKAFFE